jgi:hypothetical protein
MTVPILFDATNLHFITPVACVITRLAWPPRVPSDVAAPYAVTVEDVDTDQADSGLKEGEGLDDHEDELDDEEEDGDEEDEDEEDEDEEEDEKDEEDEEDDGEEDGEDDEDDEDEEDDDD